jgi:PEGA domain
MITKSTITKKTKNQNTQNRNMPKRSLLSIIMGFLILVLIIIIAAFINWITNSDKTATLDYYLAPTSASFMIDGKTYQGDAKIKLKPGNYTIQISSPNFKEVTQDLELKNNQVTYLYEALDPDSDHQDFYKTHPDDESRVQHIADFKADLERKSYTDSDPVFKVTPYSSYQAGFSIAAEKQPQATKVKLKITLFTCSDQQIEELKSAAYKYLTDNKLNPNNYDIEVTSC